MSKILKAIAKDFGELFRAANRPAPFQELTREERAELVRRYEERWGV